METARNHGCILDHAFNFSKFKHNFFACCQRVLVWVCRVVFDTSCARDDVLMCVSVCFYTIYDIQSMCLIIVVEINIVCVVILYILIIYVGI